MANRKSKRETQKFISTTFDTNSELHIQNCKIVNNFCRHKKVRPLLATFECDCGFIYQRLGPDAFEQDKFRYDLVREYGSVWEKKLTELWIDLSVTATEIGNEIGLQQASVVRHAIRLQLPMNTDGARKIRGYAKHHNPNIRFSEKQQKYRKNWLELRDKYPNLTRKELLEMNRFHYLWLRRNDLLWFEQHLPAHSRWQTKKDFLDWSKVDELLSTKVEVACHEIRNLEGEPIRASLSEVIRRIGYSKWLSTRKIKLPLTNQVLADYLETWEEFILRRIDWVKNMFIEQKKMPSLTKFKNLALVRNIASDNSQKIQKAIQESLDGIARVVKY